MIEYQVKNLPMRFAAYSLCLVIISFLAGCTTFHDQPLKPEQTAAAFEQRNLQDAGLRDFLARQLGHSIPTNTTHRWTSDELMLVAFFYQPDLQVARTQYAVARAGIQTAGERPNPMLNVTPGYDTTTLTPSPWIPLAVLDIPIETAGKRGYRKAQAQQLAESARLHIATVAWQVRSKARSAFVELYTAHETEALLQQQQELQTETVRLVEGQFAAGAISTFEVTQARMALNTMRLAWCDAQRKSAEAQIQLAAALGLPSGALAGVQFSCSDMSHIPGELPAATVRRQALLRRTDILGALADYAASQSALQLEIAKQYPDLHLGPGYQYDQGDNKWSLGFTLTLPILNQNKGAIAEAQARRAEAAAKFNALQAFVLAELDRAVAAYDGARQKQVESDALLKQLQQQERSAQATFAAGEISKSELAGLRLQLSTSALARSEALAQAQQALGAVEDALQSPLTVFQGLENRYK